MIKKFHRLGKIIFNPKTEDGAEEQCLATRVKIESREVIGWWRLDRGFFIRGKLHLKLARDRLGNLALDSEDIV